MIKINLKIISRLQTQEADSSKKYPSGKPTLDKFDVTFRIGQLTHILVIRHVADNVMHANTINSLTFYNHK